MEKRVPKLIRKIGFGYALDLMPASLLVGYHQLRKKLEQAGFDIKVALVPLNEMPPDLDLLFVPKELEGKAVKALSSEQILVLDNFVNHPFYSDLVKRLNEGKEICAPRAEEKRAKEESTIVRYRGYERIE